MTITASQTASSPPVKGAPIANDEPDIPVAFASVLGETPPATVPGYAASYEPTATPTPQPAIVAGDIAQAKPPAVQGQAAANGAMTPPPPSFGGRPIPPNAPPGGQWVRMKYSGNQTWGIIGGVGCGLFWCCFMIAAPLALLGLLCPCDEREAYMSPNGVMYDERGHAVGDRRRNKFVVIGQAQ
ncbi:expressed unknown protein [Seminavis robusta]|uniref:Uncharacterized protein n=1 Tax=Seminavis robusta TaxID=568900 RepID=A0A9N8F0S4_9STRA|nr:expressed unknown protein [Seminavis robusta]|eukprot:Sro2880_g339230.1 n/a (184) ;mRNA; f:4476-5128